MKYKIVKRKDAKKEVPYASFLFVYLTNEI